MNAASPYTLTVNGQRIPFRCLAGTLQGGGSRFRTQEGMVFELDPEGFTLANGSYLGVTFESPDGTPHLAALVDPGTGERWELEDPETVLQAWSLLPTAKRNPLVYAAQWVIGLATCGVVLPLPVPNPFTAVLCGLTAGWVIGKAGHLWWPPLRQQRADRVRDLWADFAASAGHPSGS